MHRLLLITYYYPPAPRVGAYRPARLVRHLPEFGWDVTVLTARLPGVERHDEDIIETPCEDVLGEWKARLHLDPHVGLHAQLGLPLATKVNSQRLHTRLISWGKQWIAFPDAMRGWVAGALQAAIRLGRTEHIDAILSTSPPVSAHVIGSRSQSALLCPWIADYRDLWNGSFITQGYQRAMLKNAAALVTVSAPLADKLQRQQPDKPVSWITNSFEPDEFPSRAVPSAGLFTITYTGTLYEGRRDPTLLLQVIQELIMEGLFRPDDVRVRFYGAQEPFLEALIEKLKLGGIVTIEERVSHERALTLQAESQLLLLIDWNDISERGIYTAKVFEYLGSRRPILALGPVREGVVEELLWQTGAGLLFTTKQELRPFLLHCYREWQQCGSVSYHGRQSVIDTYTSRSMAKRFANVLDSVIHDYHPHHVSAQADLAVHGS